MLGSFFTAKRFVDLRSKLSFSHMYKDGTNIGKTAIDTLIFKGVSLGPYKF